MKIRKAQRKDKKDLIEISKHAWENDYIPIVFDEWVEDDKDNNVFLYVLE